MLHSEKKQVRSHKPASLWFFFGAKLSSCICTGNRAFDTNQKSHLQHAVQTVYIFQNKQQYFTNLESQNKFKWKTWKQTNKKKTKERKGIRLSLSCFRDIDSTFFSSSSIFLSSIFHSPGGFWGLKKSTLWSERNETTCSLHVEIPQVPPRKTLFPSIIWQRNCLCLIWSWKRTCSVKACRLSKYVSMATVS